MIKLSFQEYKDWQRYLLLTGPRWYLKFGSILLHVPDVHVGAQRAVDKREYFVIIRDNFCQFCIKT